MTTATSTSLPTKSLLTADDIWDLPEHDNHYELVRGRLVNMPPAAPEHGMVAINLAILLGGYIKAHGLGVATIAEVGFILARNPDTLRAPDFAFVGKERIGGKPIPATFWEIVPDLVVEVISPSERFGDVQSKITDYLSAGTRMVWIVRPDNHTVTVHRSPDQIRILSMNDTLSGEDVVPGFSCPVREIFD